MIFLPKKLIQIFLISVTSNRHFPSHFGLVSPLLNYTPLKSPCKQHSRALSEVYNCAKKPVKKLSCNRAVKEKQTRIWRWRRTWKSWNSEFHVSSRRDRQEADDLKCPKDRTGTARLHWCRLRSEQIKSQWPLAHHYHHHHHRSRYHNRHRRDC